MAGGQARRGEAGAWPAVMAASPHRPYVPFHPRSAPPLSPWACIPGPSEISNIGPKAEGIRRHAAPLLLDPLPLPSLSPPPPSAGSPPLPSYPRRPSHPPNFPPRPPPRHESSPTSASPLGCNGPPEVKQAHRVQAAMSASRADFDFLDRVGRGASSVVYKAYLPLSLSPRPPQSSSPHSPFAEHSPHLSQSLFTHAHARARHPRYRTRPRGIRLRARMDA